VFGPVGAIGEGRAISLDIMDGGANANENGSPELQSDNVGFFPVTFGFLFFFV
jgi:hypothetical protein